MKIFHELYLGSTYSRDSEKGHTVQWGAYGVTPVVTMCMCTLRVTPVCISSLRVTPIQNYPVGSVRYAPILQQISSTSVLPSSSDMCLD